MISDLTDETAAEMAIGIDGALDYNSTLEGIKAEVTSADRRYASGGGTA